MSLLLILGLIGIALVLVFMPRFNIDPSKSKAIHRLQGYKWFHNHWYAGLFLFCMNAVLFTLTCLMLFALMYFTIPFVHLLVMLAAVIVSILFWFLLGRAWQGAKSGRIKMSGAGSSFYFLLSIVFSYWFFTIEPEYPGEDTFMRAVGLLFAIVVGLVGFITCFVMTGFPRRK